MQLKKFRRILTWSYDSSAFYRKLYQEVGLDPGDINGFEDIGKVTK